MRSFIQNQQKTCQNIWDNDNCLKLLQSYIFHTFEWINIARAWQTFVKAPGKFFQKCENACSKSIFKVSDSQKFMKSPTVYQISGHEYLSNEWIVTRTRNLERDQFNFQTLHSEDIGFTFSCQMMKKIWMYISLRFEISKIYILEKVLDI